MEDEEIFTSELCCGGRKLRGLRPSLQTRDGA
jgi:hypothetical protein